MKNLQIETKGTASISIPWAHQTTSYYFNENNIAGIDVILPSNFPPLFPPGSSRKEATASPRIGKGLKEHH